MTKEQKETVLSSFNAWREEKEQKKICGQNMKEQVEVVAQVLASDPTDKSEMKACRKQARKVFTYLESEDKENGDNPYQLIQIIEDLNLKS